MKTAEFLSLLKSRPLLCDGAMGTQLFARGLKPGACGELWNLDHTGAVAAIHQSYAAAGCDLITTNTFGGTRTVLARHGAEARLAAINAAGVRAARQGAPQAIILGDVGPFGDFLEPMGDTTPEQLTAIFTEQLSALHAAGADAIIIETMVDPAEAVVAIRAAKALADWPVIATFAFSRMPDRSFRTMTGAQPADTVAQSLAAGADVVGANCGTDLSLPDYADLALQLVAAARPHDAPVILQPNAGSPIANPTGVTHPATAADMAALVPTLRAAGIAIIGGCCGTTPAHLAAMAAALKA